jgi:hypothetical protein
MRNEMFAFAQMICDEGGYAFGKLGIYNKIMRLMKA